MDQLQTQSILIDPYILVCILYIAPVIYFANLCAQSDGLEKYDDMVRNGHAESKSTWDYAMQHQQSHANTRDQKFNKYQAGVYDPGQRFDYDNPNAMWGVSPKYINIKEEILNNTVHHLSLFEYQIQLEKAKKIMNQQFLKELESQRSIQAKIEWVLAVLLYCNCTDYSRKWSQSFRVSTETPTITTLKARHQEFYHCSKYLCNMVVSFCTSPDLVKPEPFLFWNIKPSFILINLD